MLLLVIQEMCNMRRRRFIEICKKLILDLDSKGRVGSLFVRGNGDVGPLEGIRS